MLELQGAYPALHALVFKKHSVEDVINTLVFEIRAILLSLVAEEVWENR